MAKFNKNNTNAIGGDLMSLDETINAALRKGRLVGNQATGPVWADFFSKSNAYKTLLRLYKCEDTRYIADQGVAWAKAQLSVVGYLKFTYSWALIRFKSFLKGKYRHYSWVWIKLK